MSADTIQFSNPIESTDIIIPTPTPTARRGRPRKQANTALVHNETVASATISSTEKISTKSASKTVSDQFMQQPKNESADSRLTEKSVKNSDGNITEPETLKQILESLDIDKAKAELCKRSFYFFLQEFWENVSAEIPRYNWHIKFLCSELQEAGWRVIRREKKESDILVNMPPGQTKSTVISQMFNAWLWCVDPTIKVIAASATDKLVQQNATKTRDIVKSEKYLRYFPNVSLREDQDVKSNFATTRGGSRIGTTVGGTIIGFHAHFIISDDIQDLRLVNSEIEREKTNQWITGTLSSRKISAESTLTIHVQQRLHPHDLTSYLLNSGIQFKHICLPAELNKSLQPASLAEHYIDGLFDPVRLSREVLSTKLIELRQKAYNAQMLQQPVDTSDNIIQEKWIPIVPFTEYQLLIQGKTPIIDFYADTAYTKESKNDPSAILACTLIGEILYILNVAQVRMEFPKLIRFIQQWTENNGYTHRSKIYVEPKASGKDIVSYLKTQSPLNIMEGRIPTSSKFERLNAVAPKVEAGKVVLVYGGWNSLLLSEVTIDEPNHDDIRDCWTAAIQDKLMKSKNYGKYKLR